MADQDDAFDGLENDDLVDLPNIGGNAPLVNPGAIIPDNSLALHQVDRIIPSDNKPIEQPPANREAAVNQPIQQPPANREAAVNQPIQQPPANREAVVNQPIQQPPALRPFANPGRYNKYGSLSRDVYKRTVQGGSRHNPADVVPNLTYHLQKQLAHLHPEDELDASVLLPTDRNTVYDTGAVLLPQVSNQERNAGDIPVENKLQTDVDPPHPADEQLQNEDEVPPPSSGPEGPTPQQR